MVCLYLLLASALIAAQSGMPVAAQTAEPQEHQLTLEEVGAAGRVYFRDTAEFPLLEHTVLTVTNASGRIRKHNQGDYDYLFEGSLLKPGGVVGTYFPRDVNPLSAIRQMWNGTLMSAIASNVHATFPVYVLLAGERRAKFTVISTESDGMVTARLGASQMCPDFTFAAHREYVPAIVCGESEVELRPDLSLQWFALDEGGLPVSAKVWPFGKTTLQSFRVEIEFQEVTVSPDPQPYVVPQRVTSTLVTAKGTLNIVSYYTPDGPPTLKQFQLQARDAK